MAHLASGLRVLLIAHGVERRSADRLWTGGLAASAIVAAPTVIGLSGGRIAAL